LALVMAPTRELTQQIEREIVRLSKYSTIRTVSIVGGQSIDEQWSRVRQGCDVIVATPGRMLDCMDRRYVVLNQCNYIVLDEADRMIDLGFEIQLNKILESMATLLKVESETEATTTTNSIVSGKHRVTSMYSATMPSEVETLAKKFLRHPVIVSIGDKESRINKRITQKVLYINESQKKKRVVEIVRQNQGPFIIFVNIRALCDVVSNELYHAGYRAMVLHGGRSQDAREAALKQFRDGQFPVLVATDVAGRGIDVPGVKHVINYDMPNSIDKYCHRIGRTGRAGTSGTATTFLTDGDEDVMYDLKRYLLATEQEVPRQLEKNPMADIKPGSGVAPPKRKRRRE